MFFDGFTLPRVAQPDGSIRLRHGGSGSDRAGPD